MPTVQPLLECVHAGISLLINTAKVIKVVTGRFGIFDDGPLKKIRSSCLTTLQGGGPEQVDGRIADKTSDVSGN